MVADVERALLNIGDRTICRKQIRRRTIGCKTFRRNLVVVEFLLLFLDQLANTNNGVGFHNALQASVTNTHPNLWKLINVLKNEEYIFLKRR